MTFKFINFLSVSILFGDYKKMAETLNPAKADALQKFRNEVESILPSEKLENDYYLLSWLEAQKFNVAKAVCMLKKHLEWRRQMGADTIIEDFKPTEVMEKYYTGGICGFDKEGCPIVIDPWGNMDMRGLLHSNKKSDIMKYECQNMELLLKLMESQTEKLGKPVHQFVIIYDLEALGMKQLWKPGIDVSNEITEQIEANYPGTLKYTYVIGAPKVFPVLFSMIKPFMSDDTVKSVRVLGSNWKEVLLKDIDADQLPVKYGGTLTGPDGDASCKSLIVYGGKIPETYYANVDQDSSNPMLPTSVSRNSTLQLPYEIKEPKSILRWEFKTEKYDIVFGIFHKTGDSQKEKDMRAIIPKQRLNSHLVPESGTVTCQEAGTYIIEFDNSYSRMRSKKLHYWVDVSKPDVD